MSAAREPASMPAGGTPLPGAGLPDPARWRVTTEPLTGPASSFDAVATAADAGHLVVGRSRTVAGVGIAAVLPLPGGLDDPAGLAAATRWLADVRPCGHPGHGAAAGTGASTPGAVAIGAFPFDRRAPAALVVPETTYCRAVDGRAFVVRVHRDGRERASAATGSGPCTTAGARFRETVAARGPALRLVPPGAGYASAVAAALDDIASGDLRKVVLARMVALDGVGLPPPSVILGRLWDGDPAFHPYSIPLAAAGRHVPDAGRRLVGASPELIVARHGARVVSHAFAGTVALRGAPGDEAAMEHLLASAKDRSEHRVVVEEIASALGAMGAELRVPPEPSVVRLRSDARLGTLVRATMRPDGGGGASPSVLDLLSALHPTPAVGGVPRARALARIAALEQAPRGYWAGTVGWVDGTGDGEWILAIRSATVGPEGADVHAGAGIVAGSDPGAELEETTVKLRPVLDALSPGASALL